MTESVEEAALAWAAEHTRKRALILEAQQACAEAEAARQTALSLAAFKSSAVRAALQGGVRATELAAALGLSRERVYSVGRANKAAGKKTAP